MRGGLGARVEPSYARLGGWAACTHGRWAGALARPHWANTRAGRGEWRGGRGRRAEGSAKNARLGRGARGPHSCAAQGKGLVWGRGEVEVRNWADERSWAAVVPRLARARGGEREPGRGKWKWSWADGGKEKGASWNFWFSIFLPLFFYLFLFKFSYTFLNRKFKYTS